MHDGYRYALNILLNRHPRKQHHKGNDDGRDKQYFFNARPAYRLDIFGRKDDGREKSNHDRIHIIR